MKKTKRFLSILLVLCMLLGLLPTTVFAAGTSITSYADVQETDWFYDAVKYASENGMMNGTGGGLFSPSMVTNRAMIVTILYRLEGEPEVTGATSFSDVAAGQWYTDAILWAAQKGVVTGYDTGLFGPDDAITREQMATILYRYAQYKEYDTTASGDVTTFTDGSSVSAYAVEAVKWAVGVGLLTGTDKGALLPTGSASRAEVATILMRFCQGFEVELPGDDTPLSGRPSGSGGSGSGGSGSGGSSSDDMSGVPEAPELPEVDDDMTVGASTDPNASAAREEANAAISQWAATQGMVLLENNNNVLPISGNAGTPVALFGVGAYNTIKGGTGSGDVYLKDGANINVRQGFEDYGYTIVNADFLDEQEALYEENGTGGGGMWGSAVYKEPAYDAEKVNAIEGTDTAIYVLARNSGEGSDRKLEGGDYYLTDEEAYNLTLLGQKFENVIVVINAGGIIDTNFFNGKGGYDADDAYNRGQIEGLDALVLMSQAGQNGGYALVEVLNGTVTPSGKLTDTWAINYEDYPSAEGFSYLDGNTYEEYYTDDIYVGYRYFDTFGLDVAYPFGYGLSYTNFEIDVTDVTADADTITVTADVTNTGDVAGQEVVEVYFSAPDGSIDKPYQELAGYQKVAVAAGKTESVTVTFATADMSSYDENNEQYVLEDGDYVIRVGDSSRNTVVAATINLNADVVTEEAANLLGLTKDDMQAGTYDADAGYILNYEDPATHKNPTYAPMELDMLDENSEGYGDYITPTADGLSAENVSLSLRAASFPEAVTYTYTEGKITTYVSRDASSDSAKYAADKTSTDTETLEKVGPVDNPTLLDVVIGNVTMEQLVADMSNVELADLVEGGTYDGFTGGGNDVEAVVGSQAESVYGAAGETTSNLYTTRFIPNIVMSDGPAGIRITNSYIKYNMVDAAQKFDPNTTYYTGTYSWSGTTYKEIEFADEAAFEAERAKGTILYTTDGQTYYQYCTAFPIGTLLAQTWDTEVIELVGRAVGIEMKEYGVTSWLAPGMNIHRNPLCGRNFEYYSEDPLVAGLTAAAETRGVETNEDGSASGVGVTLKHFAFNSQENSRMGSNSVLSERAAREIYLKGFEIAVREAKPDYIMSSYNMVNGYPTFEHYNLLTEILRNEWGFDGFVMTDWYSIGAVYGQNAGQSVQGWLNYAGNDCEMPGNNVPNVLAALEDGSIMRLGDLQRSAMAMLNVIKNSQPFELTLNKIIANSDDAELVADAKLALAILDGTAEPNETPDYNYDGLEDGSNVGASSDPGASAAREEANADISQWAATQGMVLLENNNNALPISGNAGTPVALFGVGAYNTIKGGTGSGDVYLKDGANINVRQGFEDYGYTIVNADFLDEQEALYEENGTGGGGMWGSAVYKEPAYDAEKVNAIEGTDTAIYVLARNSGEGSDRKLEGGDYYLTDEEAYNLTLLGQKFENVIVVINAGGIIDTNFFNGKGGYDADDAYNRGQIEGLDALVLMSQAGQNGGYALVEVLNGTVTPSGKLTDTWAINYEDYPSAEGFSYLDGNTYEEYYTDDIYVGYRYFDTFGVDVAYPFGYGGSYTSFTIDVTDVTASADKVTVTADVTNTGSVTGQEVVEVYFSAPDGSIDKPYQELAGYKKVEVEPGETRTVKISFDTADMSSYDESSDEYVLEAGKYIIRVGNSSRNTVQAATINLNADVVTEICTNLLGLTKDDMQAGTYDADAGYILNYEDPATHKNPTYEPMELDMLDETSDGYGDYITPTEEGLSASKVSVSLDASDFPAPVTYDYSEGSITTYVSSDETKDSAKYADGKTASDGETFEVVDAVENATLMDVVNGKITMEQLVASMSNVELADLVEGGTYDGFTEGSDDVEAVVGSQAESVYGAAGETTSNLYTTRYIPNIVMSDGPAGIRITNSYVKYDMVPGSATFDPDQTYYTASYSWGGTNYTEIEFADAEAFEAERAKGTVLYTTTGDTYYQYCTAFPIGTLLAQTWDPEVIEAVGRAVGIEMKEYGVTSWLAPGMNIHRNPLCGRNFEYYSEDPLVAGLTAAAETRGVETNEDGSASGVGVTLKHFAFNSQENSRMGSNSVVSERAAREIYLKGFEIAVREAKPDYIMSSYNMVNGYPTFEHYNLLTEILRNEWGFDGFVMTDWYSIGAVYGQNAGQNVQGWLNYAGNDCEMPGGNVSLVLDALADDSSVMRLGDLQRSAMAMLNVIQYTQAFELTLNKIILNSNDADQVAAAWNAKQVLAEAKAG